METKICSKCNEEKNICEFNKEKRNKSGLKSECKLCRKLIKKKHYDTNKHKILENKKKYYLSKKDVILEKQKIINIKIMIKLKFIKNIIIKIIKTNLTIIINSIIKLMYYTELVK
jgi:hypothetical protein